MASFNLVRKTESLCPKGNFDVERVERYVIHYPLPDGKIVPFCSYNNIHRRELKRKYSVPM